MRLPSDLDPSTEQGRQWVTDELAKGEYHDTRSLFQRFMDWLLERIQDLQATQGTGGVSLPPFVITIVVIAAVVALLFLLGKVRREGRTTSDKRTLLGDSTQTLEELRRSAAAAFDAGRYSEAVLAWTRAVARDAERRTLLRGAASLTAHEVGAELAAVFPGHAAAVADTMDLFDAVAYGGVEALQAQAVQVRGTHDALRTARPAIFQRRPEQPPPGSGDVPDSAGDHADANVGSVWTTGVRS